jgi:hypothetical protein
MTKMQFKIRPEHSMIAGLCLWFSAFVVPLILGDIAVFDDLDERLFHLPTIQRFASQLPTPDLSDYDSATTPLYHLVLSAIAMVIGDGITGLRVANLAISLATLVVAWRVMRAWGPPLSATLFTGVLAASPYFIGPAARLSTDNAALLGVFAAIGLMTPERAKPRTATLAITVALLTRQLHAWLIGLMLWRAIRDQDNRLRWLALTTVPVLALGAFVAAWGGLTPPSFAKGHTAGLNIDTLVFKLGILGLYGGFFLPWLWPIIRLEKQKISAAVGVSLVLLWAIYLPYQADPNRWGGAIWQIAARTPELFSVPLSFWVLVPAGAAILTAIGLSGSRGRYLVLCVGLWTLAGLASARAYQKYSDPTILFVLGMAAQHLPQPRRWAWCAPGLLMLGLIAVDLARFYG